MGGRLSRVYDKLAFDVVMEAAQAKELKYGNTTGENPSIYYATDENDDGDYDDIGVDGTPETDILKTDYYGEKQEFDPNALENLGKMIVIGAKNELASKVAARKFAKIIKKIGYP